MKTTALLFSGHLVVCLFAICGDAKKVPSRGGSGAAVHRGGRSPSSRKKKSAPSSTSRRRVVYEEEEYDDEDDFLEAEEKDILEEDYDAYDMGGADIDIIEEEEDDFMLDSPRTHPARSTARSGKGRVAVVEEELFEEEEEEDEYDEEDFLPPRKSTSSRPPSRKTKSGTSRRPSRTSSASQRRRPAGARGPSSRRGARRGAVVPYGTGPAQVGGAFTRGLSTLKQFIPDPTIVKDTALKAANVAGSASTSFTKGLYREIKGLTSSELEQVMLKATKPDDTPVKGKHVERLVGVTYQISARYDIYDAVLRKLWKKMIENDWRTKLKSLYILHRFSADGAPGHGPALKARLRELRRSKDPKTKEKYFNSKQLLKGDNSPEAAKYRTFTARYAHYVLLRAQCFAGMFTEISPAEETASMKSSKKGPNKSSQPAGPITSTCLRNEHLEASRLLLKAGSACTLKDGEECENTACCVERVAVDMMALTAAVATALNRAINKGRPDPSTDMDQIKLWCQFYADELLPQTKALVKKTSSKLDAYGLFLPTRLGASVSQDVLKIGLEGASQNLAEEEEVRESEKEVEEEEEAEVTRGEERASSKKEEFDASNGSDSPATEVAEEIEEAEYEYEEYYDDDGEL